MDNPVRCKYDVLSLYYPNIFLLLGMQAPVGMSAYLMHTDPTVYPEPFKFIPERWLGDLDPLMSANLVTFSRGSRMCLGMK